MKPELLDVGLASLDGLTGVDSLCLLITEDARPLPGAAGYVDWRLCGALSRVLKNGFFAGHNGERLLVPAEARLPVQRIFAVGLGPSRTVTLLALEHALRSAAQMLEKAQATSAALWVPRLEQLDDAACAAVIKRAFADPFTGAKVSVLADRALKVRLAELA